MIRVVASPSPDPARECFLTVVPPAGYFAPASEHQAEVCASLLCALEPDVRWVGQTDGMDHAIATARRWLPEIPERFVSTGLQPPAQLMVKHKLAAPEDPGGSEYVWATSPPGATPPVFFGYGASDSGSRPWAMRGQTWNRSAARARATRPSSSFASARSPARLTDSAGISAAMPVTHAQSPP